MFVKRHGKKHKPNYLASHDKATGITEKLHKRVTIKVIVGEKTFLHQFRAPATRGYSATDIEGILEHVIEYLDKKFPVLEFKQVDLLPNHFNFIASGVRESALPKMAGAIHEARRSNDAANIGQRVRVQGAPDRGSGPIILTDAANDHPTQRRTGDDGLSNDRKAES